MTKLYIIGNGFDRAHDLPTDYRNDLRNILKETDETLFHLVDELFFQKSIELWSEFECKVGVINQMSLDSLANNTSDKIQEFFANNSDPYVFDYPMEHENYGDLYTVVGKAIYQASYEKISIEESFPLEECSKIPNFLRDGLDDMISNANDSLLDRTPIGEFADNSFFCDL
ncbi:TPA: AbiH family protein [Streptococcus suis]